MKIYWNKIANWSLPTLWWEGSSFDYGAGNKPRSRHRKQHRFKNAMHQNENVQVLLNSWCQLMHKNKKRFTTWQDMHLISYLNCTVFIVLAKIFYILAAVLILHTSYHFSNIGYPSRCTCIVIKTQM